MVKKVDSYNPIIFSKKYLYDNNPYNYYAKEALLKFKNYSSDVQNNEYKFDSEINKDIEIANSKTALNENDWELKYKNYKFKNKVKYNKVLNFVEKCAKTHGNKGINIKAITNMICQLSENYGLDPELIAPLLGTETGGFVFDKKIMQSNNGYHGVMQVDYTTIETLYADDYNPKKKYKNRHASNVSYDHIHCKHDQVRIDELKKIYKTEQDLWNAIGKDVSLGVEIGIMAYKMKLHIKKGDTKAAFSAYSAGNYSLPKDSTAVKKYDIIPKYKNVID